VKANYLMSPPLVVAYALAGRMDIDLYSEPIGVGSDGKAVFLKDIWPSNTEVQETVASAIQATKRKFQSTKSRRATASIAPAPNSRTSAQK